MSKVMTSGPVFIRSVMADERSTFILARALKYSVFSVMESSFCFVYLKFYAFPTTSFVDYLTHLRDVQATKWDHCDISGSETIDFHHKIKVTVVCSIKARR